MRQFFVSLLYKTNRFHVAMCQLVIDHGRHQNVVRTSLTHSPVACVQLLCSYNILTSSVIFYCSNKCTVVWDLFANHMILKRDM